MLESVARQSKVLKEMLDTCVTVQPEHINDSIMETELAKETRREVEEEVPLPTIHSDHLKIVVRSENCFHDADFWQDPLLHISASIVHCLLLTCALCMSRHGWIDVIIRQPSMAWVAKCNLRCKISTDRR